MATDYLSASISDFLERLAEPEPGPGGGSAAAVTLTASAAIVAMVARRSRDSWPEAAGVAAQARTLQARAAPLIVRDAEVWQEALRALESLEPDLEEKVARAAEVPLRIADLAADVAELAALAAERGAGTYRGDATAAAILAHGAAAAAENLIALNLTVTVGDPRFVDAQRAARTAQRAAERALASGS